LKDFVYLQKKIIMNYTAIIEKGTNGWYIAQCAEIPAAITQGITIEDAKENLKDAIELILLDEKADTIAKMKSNRFIRRKVAI
jgi:predicted RNase H-like HicB family nuclease